MLRVSLGLAFLAYVSAVRKDQNRLSFCIVQCIVHVAVTLNSWKPGKEDVSSTLDEKDWFIADDHEDELVDYMRAWQGVRNLHLIDLFGHSQRLTAAWQRKGYNAMPYDILLGGRSDDLCGKRGYLRLTRVLAALSFWSILALKHDQHCLPVHQRRRNLN